MTIGLVFMQNLSPLIKLSCALCSIVLHFTLRTTSISKPGIPDNYVPPLSTTKYPHSLFVCLIVTLHTPNFKIFDLFYACNMNLLSLCSASCSDITLEYHILNISSSIILQSLLASTSYSIFGLVCLLLVSTFVIVIVLML